MHAGGCVCVPGRVRASERAPAVTRGENFIATQIFPHLAIHGTNQFAQTQVQQHDVNMLRYTRKIPQAKTLKNHNMLKQKKKHHQL